ncbi:unnamed protein product [Thelazia callipaeda]|uniref:Elongation of very long chain fatty acids protein n=1 Tax=Thelazia callipaeda TaxID=103827 RepID=A0A0N5CKT9_THECL|nr:unnamed protein product [Thelazia callipaeda]
MLQYESQSYDKGLSQKLMQKYRPLFVFSIVSYAIFVSKVSKIRKDRENRNTAILISCWNACNAIANIIMLIGALPDFITSFHEGLYSSLCLNQGLYTNPRTAKLLFMFHASKIWELLDTVFVIMDGRQASIIHVTHHIITSISVVSSYPQLGAVIRWISVTNLIAHSVLYSYLTAQSCVWKQRTRSARIVSGIQLIQFPICLFAFWKILQYKAARRKCETGYNVACLIIYTILFILFMQFYVSKARSQMKIARLKGMIKF